MTAKPEREGQSERNGEAEGGAVSKSRKPKRGAWSMTVTRQERIAAFGHRYQRAGAPEGVCVYCGQKASGVDHVPPLWRASLYPSHPFWLYPCCGPCNSTLGTAKPLCIFARQRELIYKLEGLERRQRPSRIDRLGTFPTFAAKIDAIRQRIALGAGGISCRCSICVASHRARR